MKFIFYLNKKKIKIEIIEKKRWRISIFFSLENTTVLTNVTLIKSKKEDEKEDNNFAKLRVNFEERFYSRNKIPNTQNRRENKINYESIINSRIIDRSIRSLFINEYKDFVKIDNYVFSIDEEEKNDPKIISIWNSFLCCFLLEELYFFNKPIGATKINKLEEKLFFNKINLLDNNECSLEMIVTSDSNKKIILLDLIGKEIDNKNVEKFIEIAHRENIKLTKIFTKIFKKMEVKKNLEVKKHKEKENEKEEKYERIDGRKLKEIRKIEIKKNYLPVKTNAFFSRGNTKTISIVTLGKIKEGVKNSNLLFEKKDENFIHHYNFLHHSEKEIRKNSISRREIGHGKLVENSFFFVIPKINIFPQTIRVVSEVISSDGSSSQSSICSSSLALLLSEVPLLRPVVGISFGLIKNKIIWDINKIEDEIGQMDLKIAGTREGITSIQLDTKKGGVNIKKIKECLIDSKKIHIFLLKKIEIK